MTRALQWSKPTRPCKPRRLVKDTGPAFAAGSAPSQDWQSKMIQALDRGLDRLYLAAGVLAAFFMIALALFVLGSIITRLMSVYVPGLTEYSGYCMAASSFFALAYTLRDGDHIRVALVMSRLTGSARRFFVIWCLAAASAIAIFMAWYLIKMTWL